MLDILGGRRVEMLFEQGDKIFFVEAHVFCQRLDGEFLRQAFCHPSIDLTRKLVGFDLGRRGVCVFQHQGDQLQQGRFHGEGGDEIRL